MELYLNFQKNNSQSENISPHFALCSVAFKLCLLESKQHKLLKSSKSKQQLPLAHCLDQSEKSKQNGHCKQEIWKFPSTKQTKILNVDQPVYSFESSKWSKLELVGPLSTILTLLFFFQISEQIYKKVHMYLFVKFQQIIHWR